MCMEAWLLVKICFPNKVDMGNYKYWSLMCCDVLVKHGYGRKNYVVLITINERRGINFA